jgi:glutathione S-transferase
MSTWGAQGDTFAPPVIVDGDTKISQSVSTCLYLGQRLGLTPPGYDQFKAMQYCLDIVDTFEGGVGKNNEDGPTLVAYLKGERFKSLMGNVERAIKGPYYFGDAPSAVDFFLLQHLDWRTSSLFGPLKDKFGIDVLAVYPMMVGVVERLRATDAYRNYAGGLRPAGPIKDEILEAFASS